MYLINITIKANQVPKDQEADLLAKHRAWFKGQYEAGNFLLVGPYRDRPMAGLVIAKAANRDELQAMIAQDAYFPDLATYEINEFQANLIAQQINDYQGE